LPSGEKFYRFLIGKTLFIFNPVKKSPAKFTRSPPGDRTVIFSHRFTGKAVKPL
jgi:hypothetical protein